MTGRAESRYAACAGLVAVASGLIAISWELYADPRHALWAAAGWALLSGVGIAGGVALVRQHGTRGSGFVLAMGTAMIVRSIAAFALLIGALRSGGGAYAPCLVGLAAGFLPQQVFEVVWFGRSRRPDDGRRGPTREV